MVEMVLVVVVVLVVNVKFCCAVTVNETFIVVGSEYCGVGGVYCKCLGDGCM
jgi:hypothetical protein